MACASCMKRRDLSRQAFENLRRQDVDAAKRNVKQIITTFRQDATRLGQGVRSSIAGRPPTRAR